MKLLNTKQTLIWRNNCSASIEITWLWPGGHTPISCSARHQRASARVTRVTRTSVDRVSCRSCQPINSSTLASRTRETLTSHAHTSPIRHRPEPHSRRSSGTLLSSQLSWTFFDISNLCWTSSPVTGKYPFPAGFGVTLCVRRKDRSVLSSFHEDLMLGMFPCELWLKQRVEICGEALISVSRMGKTKVYWKNYAGNGRWECKLTQEGI